MAIEDTATLVISCKADSQNVDAFTSAVGRADSASNKLISTLGRLFSTAVMVRFGNDAVKVFSDLEEETNKFNVVFSGMGTQTSKILKELRSNFGLSELAGKRMLAGTGDMLTGFGFGKDIALDLAEAAAKLGADLASFSNYAGGAEGATMALTKAMLGEAEPMKMLGVVINQETQEYKDMMAQVKSTGVYIDALGKTFQASADTQAKAITALALAYKQSPNAIGDFVRSQDSVANQSRILSNELTQLKANVGRPLAEAFNAGQGGAISLLRAFNQLSPEVQDFITKTGTIATGLFAAKAAYATYNTMQAITTNLSGQGAAAALAEASAHQANTAAIMAENNARAAGAGGAVAMAVNPLVGIGRQIKANKMQGYQARHDLDFARLALAGVSDQDQIDAQRAKIKALETNYRNILTARRELYAMRDMELATQQAGKFNVVADATNRQMDAMNARFRFPTFAAGAAKVRAGFIGIGTAAKGAAIAVGGIAKAFMPMLAVSAAIAGIDYLMNRSKRAAEAANSAAEANYKEAMQKSDAIKKEITAHNENIESLKILAQYSQLTTEEQTQARDIITKLSEKYGDLSNSISIVNGKLVIARDAQRKFNEEQKKALLGKLKNEVLAAQSLFSSKAKGVEGVFTSNETVNKIASLGLAKDWAKNRNIKNEIVAGLSGASYSELLAGRNKAYKLGFTDLASELDALVKIQDEIIEKNKIILGIQKNGKSPVSQLEKGGVQTTKDLDKKFNDVTAKFKAAQDEITFSGLDFDFKKIWFEGQSASLQKDFKAAAERGKHSREQQIKAYEIGLQLIDIEKQKGDLIRQNDQERTKALEEEATKQRQILESFSSAYNKFRETAQSPIAANSEQAIRLQSRTFLSPGNSLQAAAKQAAEAAKKSASAAEKSKEIQESMNNLLSEINSVIRGMGTSTVG